MILATITGTMTNQKIDWHLQKSHFCHAEFPSKIYKTYKSKTNRISRNQNFKRKDSENFRFHYFQ